jgi:tRNA threonylcarbamoyladenosine biosynthesis protein TsaE
MTRGVVALDAADEAAMAALGARLAGVAEQGLVIYLAGELGAGKTTFSRGFIQQLGHRGAVKSPTYTLVEPYELGAWQVYHFDLYRLGDPQELEFIGIRDYFSGGAICLVEWPERGEGALPPADITIKIERDGAGRSVALCADTLLGRSVIARMRAQDGTTSPGRR